MYISLPTPLIYKWVFIDQELYTVGDHYIVQLTVQTAGIVCLKFNLLGELGVATHVEQHGWRYFIVIVFIFIYQCIVFYLDFYILCYVFAFIVFHNLQF